MSGLRIDAGANRPAGPQRLNLNNVKNLPATATSSSAPATFRLQDPQGSRLRELMQQAGEAASPEQRAALQGELDRLRSELGTTANSPEVLATLAELSVANENVSAARSQLSDYAAARAATQLAQEQIRQFAPAAFQAQANAAPSSTQGLIGS
jgi:flagellin-like hook-associated protein FlgL